MDSPATHRNMPRANGVEWDYNKRLGSGVFGSIYLGVMEGYDGPVAVKEIDFESISRKTNITFERIQQEIQVHKSLDHPNIVRMLHHFWFDDRKKVIIVLEYCAHKDLEAVLKSQEKNYLNEAELIQVIPQLASAMQYLHEKNITHRDIKADNVLVKRRDDGSFIIKLSDFGTAKLLEHENQVLLTYAGTPLYMAPEVLLPNEKGKRSYGSSVDMWSFGCLLYRISMGELPFPAKSHLELNNMVQNTSSEALMNKMESDLQGVSPSFKKLLKVLISSTLERDPERRLTYSQLDKLVQSMRNPLYVADFLGAKVFPIYPFIDPAHSERPLIMADLRAEVSRLFGRDANEYLFIHASGLPNVLAITTPIPNTSPQSPIMCCHEPSFHIELSASDGPISHENPDLTFEDISSELDDARRDISIVENAGGLENTAPLSIKQFKFKLLKVLDEVFRFHNIAEQVFLSNNAQLNSILAIASTGKEYIAEINVATSRLKQRIPAVLQLCDNSLKFYDEAYNQFSAVLKEIPSNNFSNVDASAVLSTLHVWRNYIVDQREKFVKVCDDAIQQGESIVSKFPADIFSGLVVTPEIKQHFEIISDGCLRCTKTKNDIFKLSESAMGLCGPVSSGNCSCTAEACQKTIDDRCDCKSTPCLCSPITSAMRNNFEEITTYKEHCRVIAGEAAKEYEKSLVTFRNYLEGPITWAYNAFEAVLGEAGLKNCLDFADKFESDINQWGKRYLQVMVAKDIKPSTQIILPCECETLKNLVKTLEAKFENEKIEMQKNFDLELVSLKTERSSLKQQLEESNKTLDAYKEETKRTLNSELEAVKATLNSDLEAMKVENQSLMVKLQTIESNTIDLQREKADQEVRLLKEIERSKEENKVLVVEIAKLREEIVLKSELQQQNVNKIRELQEKISTLQASFDYINNECERLKKENDEKTSKIEFWKQKFQNETYEVKKLQERLQSIIVPTPTPRPPPPAVVDEGQKKKISQLINLIKSKSLFQGVEWSAAGSSSEIESLTSVLLKIDEIFCTRMNEKEREIEDYARMIKELKESSSVDTTTVRTVIESVDELQLRIKDLQEDNGNLKFSNERMQIQLDKTICEMEVLKNEKEIALRDAAQRLSAADLRSNEISREADALFDAVRRIRTSIGSETMSINDVVRIVERLVVRSRDCVNVKMNNIVLDDTVILYYTSSVEGRVSGASSWKVFGEPNVYLSIDCCDTLRLNPDIDRVLLGRVVMRNDTTVTIEKI